MHVPTLPVFMLPGHVIYRVGGAPFPSAESNGNPTIRID